MLSPKCWRGICWRPRQHYVSASVGVRVSALFKFSKVCVWRAALSSDNSCSCFGIHNIGILPLQVTFNPTIQYLEFSAGPHSLVDKRADS